ncbi:hypothetical protein K466DRAFT_182219 [Polyporus arcularius HHB13444]|uniref:Uncharacterized protein n=1 Tax=Polyporus arcularius HHB13444 TaxID=1314778 RepID=A0A5C3Q3A0_9APHY|nr:hypothetical protein K466DRAFT_182219 [Polyporus arcularius HHB13444]
MGVPHCSSHANLCKHRTQMNAQDDQRGTATPTYHIGKRATQIRSRGHGGGPANSNIKLRNHGMFAFRPHHTLALPVSVGNELAADTQPIVSDILYPTSLHRVTSTRLPRKRTYPCKRKRTRSRIHACVRAHIHALAHPSSRTPTWTTSSSSPTSSATPRTTSSLLTLAVPSMPSGTVRVSRPSSALSHERISRLCRTYSLFLCGTGCTYTIRPFCS